MPTPATSSAALSNIVACLEPAIILLSEINDAFGTPFVLAIANTVKALIMVIQNVKKNKTECVQLLQNVHQLLYAIVNLHIKSDTPGSLAPAVLANVGDFMRTLHKIYTFVEAQQQSGKILKQWFRPTEGSGLLKDCRAELDRAMETFKIHSTSAAIHDIERIQAAADGMHKNLMEIIADISDADSALYTTVSHSHSSYSSLSILPAKPQIFRGRTTELQKLVGSLLHGSARVAILGPGGMGKTSLAKAVLHHPDIISRYAHRRIFVSCDAATTNIEIAALVASHFNLKPGRDSTKAVVKRLAEEPGPVLLILDNLETAWEPDASRNGVEEFLALLGDIENLSLIVTMRGAERPAKVRWSRPFLPPLQPLSATAAQEIFTDIADDIHDPSDVQALLALTDNLPLAIDLIAHLVDTDTGTCASVLARWESEKTTFLSKGYDRKSNLDISISTSLSSPRMLSHPAAKDLLRLLSILPNGLAEDDLLQCAFPIPDILTCKTILLRTSLAFMDGSSTTKRLVALVPIREYMQRFHPASAPLIQPLRQHFHSLLELYKTHTGSQEARSSADKIRLNRGNLNQVLLLGLNARKSDPNEDGGDLVDTIRCMIALNAFSRAAGYGWLPMMDQLPEVLQTVGDHRVHVEFLTELFNSLAYKHVEEPELLVSQAIPHLEALNDPKLEMRFAWGVGYHYSYASSSSAHAQATHWLQKSLTLAQSISDLDHQSRTLTSLAHFHWYQGQYAEGKAYAIQARMALTADGEGCGETNLFQEATAMYTEAMCHTDCGDFRAASALLSRARELLLLCGMSKGYLEHLIVNTESDVLWQKSEYAAARAIQVELAEETAREGDNYNHAFALLNIAQVDVEIGKEKGEVYEMIERGCALFEGMNNPLGVHLFKSTSAALNLREGAYAEAKSQFHESLAFSWTMLTEMSFYCLERMGDTQRWAAGDFEWTSRCAVVYLALAGKTKNKLQLHKALRCLGDVFLMNGDVESAESLFVVALDGFTAMDVHRSRAECMLRVGDLRKRDGRDEEARAMWRDAQQLFERSLQRKQVVEIDERLSKRIKKEERSGVIVCMS